MLFVAFVVALLWAFVVCWVALAVWFSCCFVLSVSVRIGRAARARALGGRGREAVRSRRGGAALGAHAQRGAMIRISPEFGN